MTVLQLQTLQHYLEPLLHLLLITYCGSWGTLFGILLRKAHQIAVTEILNKGYINCNKVKFSPFCMGWFENTDWNKINLKPTNTNFARFAYSLEEEDDDDFTSIRKISYTSDDDEVAVCEIEKNRGVALVNND